MLGVVCCEECDVWVVIWGFIDEINSTSLSDQVVTLSLYGKWDCMFSIITNFDGWKID